MSKPIENQSKNSVTIVGTLINVTMREGNSKASGAPYRSGTATLRVDQYYGGKQEISEIPVSFIAMKYKKDKSLNPGYEGLAKFDSEYKSAEKVGLADATRLRISGRAATLGENMFVSSKDPDNVISSWRINSNFFNEVNGSAESSPANMDCATFDLDIFIMAISRELNLAGEETGRLKIKGGVVQYGKKLDCLDFVVEDPSAVDYIERNYNMNDTVNVKGRVRYTSEEVEYHSTSSWGEEIPHGTTVVKRELVITVGSDEPYEEDMAYDLNDIKALNQDRMNRKEQIKIDGRARAAASAVKVTKSDMLDNDWE